MPRRRQRRLADRVGDEAAESSELASESNSPSSATTGAAASICISPRCGWHPPKGASVADDDFVITVLQAHRGLAVKKRTRSAHGQVTKSDPTLNELHWRIGRYRTEADVDSVVRFLRIMAGRRDLATVHGDPAPGVDMTQWHRRLSAESHGPNRTIVEADALVYSDRSRRRPVAARQRARRRAEPVRAGRVCARDLSAACAASC